MALTTLPQHVGPYSLCDLNTVRMAGGPNIERAVACAKRGADGGRPQR